MREFYMSQLYLVPRWFFGVDVVLEIIFGIVTLLVALYSFHIYRLCYQRECRLLGFGFLSISLSYFLWSFINLFITSRLNDGSFALNLEPLSRLGLFGVYAHILLLTLGLATLAYTTLKSGSYRSYSLFATLPLLVIIFSAQKALAFYFVSSFLLLYLVLHYGIEYRNARRQTTFLLFLAFILIFVGNVSFTFSTLQNIHYVIGHLLELVGYVFILSSFLITLNKVRK